MTWYRSLPMMMMILLAAPETWTQTQAMTTPMARKTSTALMTSPKRKRMTRKTPRECHCPEKVQAHKYRCIYAPHNGNITNYALVSMKSVTEPEAPQAKDVTFVAVITSAVEMKKSQAKQVLKGVEFMFNLDEPWDTLKAQIPAKIKSVLKPKHLDFDDYNVSFFIP